MASSLTPLPIRLSSVPPPAADASDPAGARTGERSEVSESSSLRLLMLLTLYAIPLVVALRPVASPVIDPDIWWHLRVGQWVVEHRAVPHTDPLSYPLDKPWVAYSWLYEVLVCTLHAGLGLFGIVGFRVALALAVVAAIHRLVARREPRFLPAVGLSAAASLAVAGLFSERPWLFTILLGTLTLDVVLDLRAGRRTLLAWLLPVLFALWANLHIQFVYGLLLLALACVAPLLDSTLGGGKAEGEGAARLGSPGWLRLVGLSAACFLATLLNPYGLHLYGVVVEYATQPGPFRFVNELKALEFREVGDWVVLALTAAAFFALGRRRNLSTFDLLLLAGATFLAFRARRDLWLVVVAALAVLASAGPGTAGAAERFVLSGRRRLLLAGGLVAVAALTAWARDLSPANLRRSVAGVFPAQAAAVVAARGDAGPLFNDFNWGGYLSWALPHLPVVLDGRTNLHGDERIVRLGNTWAGGPGWQRDPDLCAAGVVIAPADSPLAALLQRDARFVSVHDDPVARVFVARARP